MQNVYVKVNPESKEVIFHQLFDGQRLPRQRQIEALEQQKYLQPQQEDPTKKLEKYADLRQKGLVTEEEFQKLKRGLLSQM